MPTFACFQCLQQVRGGSDKPGIGFLYTSIAMWGGSPASPDTAGGGHPDHLVNEGLAGIKGRSGSWASSATWRSR